MNGVWIAFLGKKRTDEETAAMRAACIADYGVGEIEFSCDTCAAKNTCEYAFDQYNTNGDCLAEK